MSNKTIKNAQLFIVLAISIAGVFFAANHAFAGNKISYRWINDNSINCHTPGNSSIIKNGVISWTADFKNLGPSVGSIEAYAFHDPKSGCAPTVYPNNPPLTITGKINYTVNETGQIKVEFDTKQFTCGRVQVDAGFKVASTGESIVFLGEIVNYGKDCTTPPDPKPQPQSCIENAALTSPKLIPATIDAGQNYPFQVLIYNSGETYFYHGSYFQLVQKNTNQSINPPYGHLTPGMFPGDDQLEDFVLTAPANPGTYTISFQMVHRTGADYRLPNQSVCGPITNEDVYFGNVLTMTFTVIAGNTNPTGNIVVNSNIPSAWTIAGTDNYSGSGLIAVYANAKTGTYSIINIPGNLNFNNQAYQLKTISNGTQNLAANQTITFTLVYDPITTIGFGLNAPQIISISNLVCTQLTLVWKDNSSNEDGFAIYRSEQLNNSNLSQYQLIKTVGANVNSYIDHPPINKSYYYIVVAFTNNPSQNAASSAFLSAFNVACKSIIKGTMDLIAVNGQSYNSQSKISNGDTVTIQIMVDNLGPAESYITKIIDNLGINLTNPRNLVVSGPNAKVGSPAISSVSGGTLFSVSGKKEVGGLRWLIKFDATVITSQTSVTELENCATIYYFDDTGPGTENVCFTKVLTKPAGGVVQFREIAP